MSRKCKCKICGKQLTTDTAYKITNYNGKNTYYCSKEEYDEVNKKKEIENRCYNTISTIMNIPFVTPMLKKQIKKIVEFYDYPIIERTFKENEKAIKWFLDNNEDSSEYGKSRYIMTIIINNINGVARKYKEEQKRIKQLFESNNNNNDISIINDLNDKQQIKRDVSDISEFLDD